MVGHRERADLKKLKISASVDFRVEWPTTENAQFGQNCELRLAYISEFIRTTKNAQFSEENYL